MSLIQSIEQCLLRIMEDKMREFGSLNNLNEEQINATLERMDLVKSLTMPLVVSKSASGLIGGAGKKVSGKVRVKKSNLISLPFNKSCVKEELCCALEYNQGLFTQCKNNHLEESMYCGSCQEEVMKSDNGVPSCGTVGDRLEKGLMEFRDGKGRAPISYLNYLKKKNSSVEEARRIAEENGESIDEEHFEERRGRPKKVSEESQVAKSEKRGRPKKAPVEVKSSRVIDLFASSVEEVFQSTSSSSSSSVVEVEVEGRSTSSSSSSVSVAESADNSEDDASVAISESQVLESKKVKRTKEEKLALEQEKEAKRLAAEQEKEAKKLALEQEKEAKRLAAEQEKEAKRLAAEQEKAARAQEKEAKKLAAEQEKATKAQEKAAKAQEKATKAQEKAAKAQEKEANKGEKKTKKSSSKEETKVEEPLKNEEDEEVEEEETAPKVQVEEFKFEGVTYWRSSENLLYNPISQECVGVWCENKHTILPPPEESDDELEEEEYESDDE
jgi:hypothetical protein